VCQDNSGKQGADSGEEMKTSGCQATPMLKGHQELMELGMGALEAGSQGLRCVQPEA
jgi:hypothetical protein